MYKNENNSILNSLLFNLSWSRHHVGGHA